MRDFPWRREFRVWPVALAEVLLARTPARRVVPVYEKLMEKYPSPLSVRAMEDVRELVEILKPLGLQKRKAAQIKALADALCRTLDETLLEELREVPGIGRYSYNAILLFGFGIARPIVDENVGRVFSRYFGMKWNGKAVSDDRAWQLAHELVPRDPEDARVYSYGLLDLAAQICKKKPHCNGCPLRTHCDDFSKRRGLPLDRLL